MKESTKNLIYRVAYITVGGFVVTMHAMMIRSGIEAIWKGIKGEVGN